MKTFRMILGLVVLHFAGFLSVPLVFVGASFIGLYWLVASNVMVNSRRDI